MKTPMMLTGCLVAGMLAVSCDADAALLVGRCQGAVNPTVTCDTATGLEWLDLNKSVGYSINEVLAGAGGFQADGWSVANGAQVDGLFLDAGLSPTALGALQLDLLPSDRAAVELLLSTLGAVSVDHSGDQVGIGLSVYGADLSVAGSVSLPYYISLADDNAVKTSGSVYRGSNLELTGDSKDDLWGVFLTRSVVSVPEPGVLSLFGIMVVAVAFRALWRRRRTHFLLDEREGLPGGRT